MTTPEGGADLHLHTTASDGTDSPTAMVAWARDQGLACIAVTDHDTVAGIAEAAQAGERFGISIIPGVELSCSASGAEIHVLGYLCQWDHPPLVSLLESMRAARRRRAERSVQRLRKAGFAVDLDAVLALGGDAVGRPHIARALVEAGYATSIAEAFSRFLARGRVGYEPRQRLRPSAAVAAIRAAGGVPVLAHPGLIGNDDWVTAMVEAGVMGIEAYHTDHTPAQSRHYAQWAESAGLIVTGGSDSHGQGGSRPVPPGHVRVGLDVVARLRAAARASG